MLCCPLFAQQRAGAKFVNAIHECCAIRYLVLPWTAAEHAAAHCLFLLKKRLPAHSDETLSGTLTCGGCLCLKASAVGLFRLARGGGGRGLGIVLQAAQSVNLSL